MDCLARRRFCACAEVPFNFVCTCAVSSVDYYRFLLYLSGSGVSTDEFIVRHRFINNMLSINVKVGQHAGLECNDPHLRWCRTFFFPNLVTQYPNKLYTTLLQITQHDDSNRRVMLCGLPDLQSRLPLLLLRIQRNSF